MAHWKHQARSLKREVYATYLACRDPRVPWHAKAVAALVVGYALSPIDLIPDFIPILGYLDDLILVPLGMALALKLIPAPIMVECREKARVDMENGSHKPVNWIAACLIVCVWLAVLAFIGLQVWRYWRGPSHDMRH